MYRRSWLSSVTLESPIAIVVCGLATGLGVKQYLQCAIWNEFILRNLYSTYADLIYD